MQLGCTRQAVVVVRRRGGLPHQAEQQRGADGPQRQCDNGACCMRAVEVAQIGDDANGGAGGSSAETARAAEGSRLGADRGTAGGVADGEQQEVATGSPAGPRWVPSSLVVKAAAVAGRVRASMGGMTGAGITPRTGPSMAAAIVPMAEERASGTASCPPRRRGSVPQDAGGWPQTAETEPEMTVRFAVWDQITGAAEPVRHGLTPGPKRKPIKPRRRHQTLIQRDSALR
ncbi:hypothetical protein SHIRM173S_00681 [Streptomyces hirsutus]